MAATAKLNRPRAEGRRHRIREHGMVGVVALRPLRPRRAGGTEACEGRGCVSPVRCAAERGAAPRSARSTTNGWNAGRNFLKLHKSGIVVATVTPKARSPLIRELETRVAGLMNLIAALDDLVLQFDSTPAGRNFIAEIGRASCRERV